MTLTLVSFARWLVLTVGLVLLLLFGIDQIYTLQFDMLPGSESWQPLAELPRTLHIALALLATLLPIFYLFLVGIEGQLHRGIVGRAKGSNEPVRLTPEAVESQIRKEIRNGIEEVRRVIRCKVRQAGSGPKIDLKVAVYEGPSVPEVRRQIKQAVQNTLQRLIGDSAPASIHIKVAEISDASRKKQLPKSKSVRKPKNIESAPPVS